MKFFWVLLLLPAFARAGVYLSQDKALQLAFPGGGAERATLFLSPDDQKTVQTMARARVEASVVTYYTGKLGDGSPGFAFFETHVVRTMPETVMTVVDAGGRVRFVEVLSFYEPEDYRPSRRWLDQFKGRSGDDDLVLKRGIRNMAGATLTAQSIADGVRRASAMQRFVARPEGKN